MAFALRHVQKDRSWNADHTHTDIYAFFSPVTRDKYVVRAEFYRFDIVAFKFYRKRDRKSKFRYHKIVNKGGAKTIFASQSYTGLPRPSHS